METYTNSHSDGPPDKPLMEKPVAIEMEPLKQSPDAKVPDEDEEETGWDKEDEDEHTDNDKNICFGGKVLSFMVEKTQLMFKTVYKTAQRYTGGRFVGILLLLLYTAYFITALCYRSSDEGAHRLIGCTVLVAVILLRGYIATAWRWLFVKVNGSDKLSPTCVKVGTILKKVIRWLLYILLAVISIWALIDEGKKNPKNLRSLPGLFIFILICLFVSVKPSRINWHTIYWSLGLQFLFALFALRWETGKECILWLQRRVDGYFVHTKAGSSMLFGENYQEHMLIFGALPVFLFTNATIAILYYLGAMQFIVRVIGKFLEFVLDTTPIEAVSVALGIFLEGIACVAALLPYMRTATKSQLFLIMTSAYASIGGGFMALLASIQIPSEHLIAAMIISAPATFAVCKLMWPETQKVVKIDTVDFGHDEKKKYTNVLDAAQSGSMVMLGAIGGLAVSAFSTWSFISWINATLTWFGDRVGIDNLTIEEISSKVLYPVSLMMGVEPDDCENVGMLLGYRFSSTNLVAFIKMVELKINRIKFQKYMLATNFTGPISHHRNDIILDHWNMTLKDGFISERSEAIATYSLTGFSSIVSSAMALALLTVFLPERKVWMAKVVIPALIAGNIANCMTGCFASLFY